MKKVICGIVFLLFCLIPMLAAAAPFAYISNYDSNTVSVIDTATNIVSATISVGANPWGVAVNTSGTLVYVGNVTDNTVSVIDTATNTVSATISVGNSPVGVALNPSGTHVYVDNRYSNTVSVIDTATNIVSATISVGNAPIGVALNPSDTLVYIANYYSNNVSVIDTATNIVSATISVGNQPHGIAVDPSGTHVYVGNVTDNTVSVIDTATNTVNATISVGNEPWHIVVNPSGTHVYVANVPDNTVSVIDTATNTVSATISVGNWPFGVAVNPSGTHVYVANHNSNNVSVIDTATNIVTATIAVGNAPVAFGNFIGSGARINDGLVAYYPFNGNANDESGNGHNGTVYGATLTTDRFGNPNSAYTFNGTSDYVDLANTASFNPQQFSIAAWVNFSADNFDEGIVGKHICGYANGYFLGVGNYVGFGTGPNSFEFFVSSEGRAITEEKYNDGLWHFVAGVYDGTQEYLYVDGGLKASQPKSFDSFNDVNISIGRAGTNCVYTTDGHFNGSIDEVRIYNRALSLSEVQDLYNTNPPQQQYALTVSKSGTGNGTVTPDSGTISWVGNTGTASYSAGTTVKLTAEADADSSFVGWSGCDSVNGNQCTVTMNNVRSVTATFTLNPTQQYTLTITKSGNGNGRITSSPSGIDCGSDCSSAYNQGTVVTLTAIPDNGSIFAGWNGGGCTGIGACITTINTNTTVTATFTQQGQQGNPKISVSPMSVNLGSVRVGSTSNPKTVTIKNTGSGDLVINSITISGSNQSEFIQTNNCSIIPAKSSCPIIVTFNPVLPFGKKSTIISISSNDLKKPLVNVRLSGEASPPKISVSPKSVNFGSVAVGATSAPKTVTIKNTGISDLAVNAITITGTNAAEFSETNNCSTVVKGSSCAVTVTFSPAFAGGKTAIMSIASNDPKTPTINVKLSGKGTGSSVGCLNIAGTWSGTVEVTDADPVGITLYLSQNGCNVTGTTVSSAYFPCDVPPIAVNGTVNGNIFSATMAKSPVLDGETCEVDCYTPSQSGSLTINGDKMDGHGTTYDCDDPTPYDTTIHLSRSSSSSSLNTIKGKTQVGKSSSLFRKH